MRLIASALVALAACADAPSTAAVFSAPQRVEILGYAGDAMEPFLSRDGGTLFFNNRNEPAERTDLHWAERVDDATFRYRGLVEGANTPDALEGVATLAALGRFCFVSTRAYAKTLATVHCGTWRDGTVEEASLQTEATPRQMGRVIFDVEINSAGDTLYLADGRFRGGPVPQTADLRIARWGAEGFALAPADDAVLALINTPALDYAAAISADGLELAFTRMSGRPPFARTEILIARREREGDPFEMPRAITAIDGFVEGPTFSPDGAALYYHRRVAGRFEIWRVERR